MKMVELICSMYPILHHKCLPRSCSFVHIRIVHHGLIPLLVFNDLLNLLLYPGIFIGHASHSCRGSRTGLFVGCNPFNKAHGVPGVDLQ